MESYSGGIETKTLPTEVDREKIENRQLNKYWENKKNEDIQPAARPRL